MTVDSDRLFKWGIVLLLAYPLVAASYVFLFSLPELSGNLNLFLEQGYPHLFMLARYGGVAGLLMVVAHYFQSAGREEKRYRRLDYLVILLLFASVAVVVAVVCLNLTDRPGPYKGFANFLFLGRLVIQAACVLGWAYGIWRLRMPWLLFCSVLVMALGSFPQIPNNAPDFARSFMVSQENASKYRSSLETSEEPQIPDSEVIENGEDRVQVTSSTSVLFSVDLGGMLYFLLIPVYTFMRWGGRLQKRGLLGTGGVPDMVSRSSDGWVYATGEACLFLALPLAVAGAVVLSFLQTQWPRFTWNTSALMEAGLVVLTAALMALVFPRVGVLSPKRLEKADRGLGRVLLFLLLFPVASGFAAVYEWVVEGTIFPASTVESFGDLFYVAIWCGFHLAAVLVWYRGVQKKRPLLAVCGSIVFVSLLVPQAVLSSLYPHVPFPSDVEASLSNDDSVLEEGEKDIPQDNTTVSKSDVAHFCERMCMPWGTNRVHLIFFPQYIRMHVTALLLFTLMRFWGDVFSRGKASPEEEPALT